MKTCTFYLSNPTHQGTREMCQIVQDVRTCLIQHTKGPGICVRLYRMSEYSGFILVNRTTLRPSIFVGCHRMSENSGVGLLRFHCIYLFVVRDGFHFVFNVVFTIVQNSGERMLFCKRSRRIKFDANNFFDECTVLKRITNDITFSCM